MLCPKCGYEQADGNVDCPRCGIIFEKIRTQPILQPLPADKPEEGEDLSYAEQIKDLLFSVKPDTNPFYLGGRGMLFLILFLWGFKFFFAPIEDNYPGTSFLHLVNLPFHEAGHVIFGFFGEFIAKLGGSLAQLIMPLICLFTFLIKMRDPFAASVTLWWFGESFMDLAPYINDARALNLILIGGVTGKDVPDFHDWEYILGRLNLLPYDHFLAGMANALGIACMLTAYLWGGYLLYKEYAYQRANRTVRGG